MSIVDEHAVLKDRGGPQRFELFIRIQRARAEFEAREIAAANQRWTINRRGHVHGLVGPQRIGRRQRLARDAVIMGVHNSFGEINEPAIFHAALVKESLRSFSCWPQSVFESLSNL